MSIDGIEPLWKRALDNRDYLLAQLAEEKRVRISAIRSAAAKKGGEAAGKANRKYPRAQIGDIFGTRTVVALLPSDARSNERVRVRCPSGHEIEAHVYNLRSSQKHCFQCWVIEHR